MGSTARDILDQVLQKLRAINGGATYRHDLSDTVDRVRLGVVWPPDFSDGQLFIQDVEVTSAHEDATGYYRRTMRITVQGWVAADGNTSGIRALAALDLLDDVDTAMTSDRTLGGKVLDVIMTASTAVDGLEELGVEMGGFAAVFEVYWRTTGGV